MKYEVAIRLGFFIAAFGTMTIWELLAPRRILTTAKTVRWHGKFVLFFFTGDLWHMSFLSFASNRKLSGHRELVGAFSVRRCVRLSI